MNIIEKVIELLKEDDSEEVAWVISDHATPWPQVKEDPDDPECNYMESVCTENWGFSEINEKYIIFSCGGDWQEPVQMKIELVDNNLVITDVKYNVFEDSIKYPELVKIFKLGEGEDF
jgi:hypothetical protein